MFYQDSLFCQLLIILLLRFGQWFVLGCLKRDLGIPEQFENPLKPLIYLDLGILIDFQAAFFENLKIVFGASGASHRKNDSSQKTNY